MNWEEEADEEKEPPLGEGTTGKVYLSKHTGTVVKCLGTQAYLLPPYIIREIVLLSHLQAYWLSKEQRGKYSVKARETQIRCYMPYAPQGDVSRWLQTRHLTWEQYHQWTSILQRMLSQMHQLGWVHGDLKLENIVLMEDSQPLLVDFGLSFSSTQSKSEHYTLRYRPPEATTCVYNQSSDVWAYGIVLYYLVTRSWLFPSCTPSELYHHHLQWIMEYHQLCENPPSVWQTVWESNAWPRCQMQSTWEHVVRLLHPVSETRLQYWNRLKDAEPQVIAPLRFPCTPPLRSNNQPAFPTTWIATEQKWIQTLKVWDSQMKQRFPNYDPSGRVLSFAQYVARRWLYDSWVFWTRTKVDTWAIDILHACVKISLDLWTEDTFIEQIYQTWKFADWFPTTFHRDQYLAAEAKLLELLSRPLELEHFFTTI